MSKYIACFIVFLGLFSCKKYQDPEPFSDSRIITPYCNDPSAVNYNWGFPGVVDNSTCIYPSDVFKGQYSYVDSTLSSTFQLLRTDTFQLSIVKQDSTRMSLSGFCGSNSLQLRANKYLKFVVDSIVRNGQIHCNILDTIVGGGQKISFSDTNSFSLSYQIISDTGISLHKGTALKN